MTIREGRLGTTFHESFPLNRPALSSVLEALSESPRTPLGGLLRETTSLGPNYVKAMPRYLRGTGLLELGADRLTPWGQQVQAKDPQLAQATTQWLMHYHLAAPLGPGPQYWHDLVLALPTFPSTFVRDDVIHALSSSLTASGSTLRDRTVDTAATVFLGTYTKAEALGNLGLIREGLVQGHSDD